MLLLLWEDKINLKMNNCSKDEFERVNPNQFNEYKYDCGIDIEFLK